MNDAIDFARQRKKHGLHFHSTKRRKNEIFFGANGYGQPIRIMRESGGAMGHTTDVHPVNQVSTSAPGNSHRMTIKCAFNASSFAQAHFKMSVMIINIS